MCQGETCHRSRQVIDTKAKLMMHLRLQLRRHLLSCLANDWGTAHECMHVHVHVHAYMQHTSLHGYVNTWRICLFDHICILYRIRPSIHHTRTLHAYHAIVDTNLHSITCYCILLHAYITWIHCLHVLYTCTTHMACFGTRARATQARAWAI